MIHSEKNADQVAARLRPVVYLFAAANVAVFALTLFSAAFTTFPTGV